MGALRTSVAPAATSSARSAIGANALGCAQGQRCDSEGRIHRGRRRQNAGVHHLEIWMIESTAFGIDRSARRITSYPNRATLMRGRASVERLRQHKWEAGDLEKLAHPSSQPVLRRHVRAPPIEHHARSIKAHAAFGRGEVFAHE